MPFLYDYFFAGVEYRAVVEFAPFQRIPKDRPYRKKDLKAGTIESCPFYQEFAHSVKNSKNEKKTNTANTLSYNYSKKNSDEKTPLLKYISEKKKLRTNEDKKEEWKYYTKKGFKDGSTCIFVNSSVKKRFV